MQTIASIYVRTPQGRVAAFSNSAKLPDHLKKLLLAVDGKTASTYLAQQRIGQGDITAWLSQLETYGLIEDKQLAGRASSYGQNSDQIWGAQRAPEPASNVHFMRYAAPSHHSVSTHAFAPPQNSAWLVTSAGGLGDDVPAQSLESVMADLTQQVVDVMATFILTYLPEKAFEVLKELESLRSLGQLKATLPSYEMMVNSAGHAGRQHMLELQEFIHQHFAPA